MNESSSPVRDSRLGWLLAATTLVFLRIVTTDYVQWDDNVLISENEILKRPFGEALRLAFTTFYHGDFMPLTLMSFWFDVAMLKLGGPGQHVENLLLHLLNVTLLWKYLARLKVRAEWRFFVCGVFALHPVQVESVSWVSERKGLLSGALLLVGAHASLTASALRENKAWGMWALYAVAYGAAFLAKANGILLPLVLFMVERAVAVSGLAVSGERGAGVGATRRRGLSGEPGFGGEMLRLFMKHGFVLGLGALGAVVRVKAYESSIPELMGATWSFERLIAWPAMACAAIGYYFRLFFWPYNLSIIYPSYDGGSGWGIWTALGCVGISGVAAWAWGKRDGLAGVLGLTFLFLLAPVLQIVPRINFVNDRYLYLPVIALAGLVANGAWPRRVEVVKLKSVKKRKNAVAKSGEGLPESASSTLASDAEAFGGISLAALRNQPFLQILILLAIISFARVKVWSSNAALWKDTSAKNPENGIARNNHAQALQAEGKLQEAIQEYEQVLVYGRKDGTDNLAFNNLGILYSSPENKGIYDLAKAEALLKEGIARAPRPEEAFTLRFNLAQVYLQKRSYNEALNELQTLKAQLLASQNQRYAFLVGRVDQILAILQGAAK